MQIDIFQQVQWAPSRSTKDVFSEILGRCLQAEALGFGTFWFAEHHLPSDGLLCQPLVTACALALRTKRIRVGVALNGLPSAQALRLHEGPELVTELFAGRVALSIWCSPSDEALPYWAGAEGLGLLCDASTSTEALNGIRETYVAGQTRHRRKPERSTRIGLLRAVILADSMAAARQEARATLGDSLDEGSWSDLDAPIIGDPSAVRDRLAKLGARLRDYRLVLNFSLSRLPSESLFGSISEAGVAE